MSNIREAVLAARQNRGPAVEVKGTPVHVPIVTTGGIPRGPELDAEVDKQVASEK